MRSVLSLALIIFATVAVLAAPEEPDCADERSHQFDFWIGEWEVEAGGELAGTNSIRPILDGCVLQETWVGAKGSAGSSFNFFNPSHGEWQQFWVWRNGTTLELEGSYETGKMILQGESVGGDGATVANRITWYDNEDGTVRQHWQVSKDAGETWETAFDGLYRRAK